MPRRILIGLALILAIALSVSIYRFNAAKDAGPALSGESLAELVRSATEGCLTRQKAATQNASVAPETIASYCACYGAELGKRLTAADVDRLRGQSEAEMRTAMRPKMADSEDACFARLDEKK